MSCLTNHVQRIRATDIHVSESEALVKENFEVLNSKITNQVTDARKFEIWKDINCKISALRIAERTEQDCVEKWANLKRKTKMT
jgi:hypothetical protein